MNQIMELAASAEQCITRPIPVRRPIRKRVMHLVRRVHLYFGLFLFPWAVLYGVTAFLFNHPAVFPDQPVATFSREDTVGTPLESLPSPNEQANAIVAALNEKQKPEPPYRLGSGDARYATRDFIFATVKAGASNLQCSLRRKKGRRHDPRNDRRPARGKGTVYDRQNGRTPPTRHGYGNDQRSNPQSRRGGETRR